MIVRRLDEHHDWIFGQGLQNYTGASEAISQCVKTALMSLRSDWFLNIDHGVRWFNYLKKSPNLVDMEQELKRTVLSIDGVVQLVDFDIDIDPNIRKCTVMAAYIDIYDSRNEVIANVTSD